MDSQRLSNWIQLFTAIAVIGGLALVVLELRQSKELTQVQIVSEAFTRGSGLELAKMGEDPRGAIYKATFSPDELTQEEAVALDGYLQFVTMHWWEMWLSDEIAGIDRRWRENVYAGASVVFSSEPAIRWFEVQQHQMPPEIAEIARDAIDSNANDLFAARLDAILGRNNPKD